MSPLQRIRHQWRYVGLLLHPGDDGLRPYERRRLARKWEREMGAWPKRTREEVERMLARPRCDARNEDGSRCSICTESLHRHLFLTRDGDGKVTCVVVDR